MIDTQKLTFNVGPLDLRSPAPDEPVITLWPPASTQPPAPLVLTTQAQEYTGFVGINEVFILRFNAGAVAGQPGWSENFESHYPKDAPPNGMLERHWNYTSLDGAVAFRPWTMLYNLNDHRGFEWSVARRWAIHGYYGGAVSDEVYAFTTGDAGEGQATFRRPQRVVFDSAQLVASVDDEGHRATLSIDPSFTHGVADLRPAAYSGGFPASFSYVNLTARRLELAFGSGEPAALSFRGSGTGGDSVGFKAAAGSGVLQFVAAGLGMEPSTWSIDPSFGQAMAAPTLVVNANTNGVLGGARGAVAIANAHTVPASNPSGGGVLYVQGGSIKYRGSAGTVTVIGPA